MKVFGDLVSPTFGPLQLGAMPVWTGAPKDIADNPYQILPSDGYGIITSIKVLTANRIVTLPSATASQVGRVITFKKADNSNFAPIIAPNGIDTIDGLNTNFTLLTSPGSQVTLQCFAPGIWIIIAKSGIAPTVSRYTTGGATGPYTTPKFVTCLDIALVGGGGGGGGGATGAAGASGIAGQATTWSVFSGSAIVTCGGGGKGGGGSLEISGPGGSVTIAAGLVVTNMPGATGNSSTYVGSGFYSGGGCGGSTFYGGAGGCLSGGNNPGVAGQLGSGSGGSGGATMNSGNNQCGHGGSAGGFARIIIPNPAAQYDFFVGDGGNGGAGGGGGGLGGKGGSGSIIVTEYYT